MLSPEPEIPSYPKPTKILSKRNLCAAWFASKDCTKQAGRPGIDGINASSFALKFDQHITSIASELHNGSFTFHSLRPVFIPKPNSLKERMICVPTIKDRLVQRAIVQYLEENKKLPIYNGSSFGFIRGGGGTKAAIAAALLHRERHDWCLKTDIESFFDKIPRPYLRKALRAALGHHSLIPILDKVIDCEVSDIKQANKIRAQGISRGVGVRQGMPLSPIFANVVLAKFDATIEARKIPMVRYADDLALFFNSKREAEEGKDLISALLKQLSLGIPELIDGSKTQIISTSDPLDFLGYELLYIKTAGKFVARVSDKQIRKIKDRLLSDYSLMNLVKEGTSFQSAIAQIERSISSYCGIYKNAYNANILRNEMTGISRKITSQLFIDLFGKPALNRLSEAQRKFIGLKVNEIVAADDLEI